MIEEWKDIQGYDGDYKISNLGKVQTLKPFKEGMIKPRSNKYGYENVILSKNGVTKQFKVHRLVLMHFMPNPENKPYVNHIDSNRKNNILSNLEWSTPKENAEHAWTMGGGTIQEAQRRRNVTQKFKANVKYKQLQGQQFGSIKLLGNITFERGNVTADTVCMRCGTTKRKNIRAELKGKTKMCISCKNKSMGRLRKHLKHEDIVSSA